MSSLPEITVRDRVDGINGFLRKPFTEVELLRMVARCLDGGT
jgi:FixJ family two-component response regulator